MSVGSPRRSWFGRFWFGRATGPVTGPVVGSVVAVVAVVAALVAPSTLPGDAASPPERSATAWTPLSPVSVTYSAAPVAGTARVRLLSFNDFHGAIDPPTGSGGLVNGVPAGGVEYLATTVRRLRAQAGRTPTLTVGAGDMVGASPLVSAAFHDEPTVEALSTLGLEINAVGNHEFDEGVAELQRLQYGGCHPTDGCQDGDGFRGARFRFLAANVVDRATRKPIFPAYTVRTVGGVRVGFVGMTLRGTPGIVNPAGVASVDFLDEVAVANHYADLLATRHGVKALVLLLHQGGSQEGGATDPSGCAGFTGDLTGIVRALRPAYGVVVSGHTHRAYSCSLPNAGGTSVVTSAGSNGVLVTAIDAALDRRTGRFATVSARNVVVENGVREADGGWRTDETGGYVRDPALVDRAVKRVADKYRTAVAPIANRVVGAVTADLTNAPNPAGESALGDVVADAQLAYTATSAGAQIALMNPGGIRASLIHGNSPGGEAPGQVTYGEAFTVQPFNNLVVTQTFTGRQLAEVLEQQFVGYGGQTTQRILQVSAGFAYRYDASAPAGQRVSGMTLHGAPIDPVATYRVTTNDFLANGGDGFTRLTAGTDRATAPGFDVDALIAYLGAGAPVAPGPQDRITTVN